MGPKERVHEFQKVTGFFVRVRRGARVESVDLANCTESELRRALRHADRDVLLGWVVALTEWIRKTIQD